MSDTPRTDAAEKHAYEFKDEYTPVCESKLVRQLERELNAANAKIKRLEDALRRIANQDYRGNRSTESQIAAEALKEAKP